MDNIDIHQKIVVVLGMHRSGTSVLAHGLEVLGVEFGSNLLPPQGDNPKGFWEDIEINKLNIDILISLGTDWSNVAPINVSDMELLRKDGCFQRAVNLVQEKVSNTYMHGFKDPRFTKLLPFWNDVFLRCQLDVSYVLALRHPLSVAHSLHKRNGFEIEQSYLMWLGHVILSLVGSAGYKRIIVDYDRLMQSSDCELERVAQCLVLDVSPEKLQTYKSEFLDRELTHSVYSIDDLHSDTCPPIVNEVYTALLEIATESTPIDEIQLQNKVVNWLDEFMRLKSPLQLIDRLYTQNSNAVHAIAERDSLNARLDKVVEERDAAVSSLAQVNLEYSNIESLCNDMLHSNSWRITAPLRWPRLLLKRVKRFASAISYTVQLEGGLKNVLSRALALFRREGLGGLKRGLLYMRSGMSARDDFRFNYSEWLRCYDTISDNDRAVMHQHMDSFTIKPKVSIIIPTYNPKPEWLIKAIESVRSQIYPNWEICIADDASTDVAIRTILENYVKDDARIKVMFREENGHISAASNSALELAAGDWIALMDHDDLLPEHALFWVVEAINRRPDVRMIYSDEDKVDSSDNRHTPYFKCDWNLDLFLSHNMFCHLGVYERELIKSVNGFRLGFEGAQDYDLALHCIEKIDSNQIYHIPRVLYHWRVHSGSTAHSADAKPYATLAAERALNEHFERIGVKASVASTKYGFRAQYNLPKKLPLVSLIIPTRNGLSLLQQCIDSIIVKTTYPNYEIIVVDNGSNDPEILVYFEKIASEYGVKILKDDRPFNYSQLNNAAVEIANGEIIGLINNDIEVISEDWLSEMVSHALRPEVGAVGAKLLYPDGTLQHGGVVLGVGGVAGHSHKHFHKDSNGYFSRLALISEYSSVTAACLVIKKSIYSHVGGFNEYDLKVAFNDVDFCLRVREAGYHNIWTPYAELYHHESVTRGYEDTPEKQARFSAEVEYMKEKWGCELENDPAYSPNLTLDYQDFSYAWPPRVNLIKVVI